jgi:phosphoribosylformylglycinamidine cyclo-ligase
MRYKDAGVDAAAAHQAKQRIRSLASRTFGREVLAPIGSFGGLFALDTKRWRDPVLVASADGVGTKLKVAFAMGVHCTVGADLVYHSVNDVVTQGAQPLFFLDYLSLGKMDPHVVEEVVEGISLACVQVGCALIGGETAEMPEFYPPGEYDLAGFILGVVERDRILGPRRVRAGDVLLGLPSNGLHTNGYALARKLVFEVARLDLSTYVPEVGNKIGAELLKPHRCYWPLLEKPVANGWISAMAHITGGGLTGNLPRALPRTLRASVELGSWPVPPIFSYLARLGQLERDELLRTFNMGLGMVLIVPPAHLTAVEAELKRRREKFWVVGKVEHGAAEVLYQGKLPG